LRKQAILKHKRDGVVVVHQRDWSRQPVSVKFGFERIFVFKPLDVSERGFFRRNEKECADGVIDKSTGFRCFAR
jgi:hypothetical protein